MHIGSKGGTRHPGLSQHLPHRSLVWSAWALDWGRYTLGMTMLSKHRAQENTHEDPSIQLHSLLLCISHCCPVPHKYRAPVVLAAAAPTAADLRPLHHRLDGSRRPSKKASDEELINKSIETLAIRLCIKRKEHKQKNDKDICACQLLQVLPATLSFTKSLAAP